MPYLQLAPWQLGTRFTFVRQPLAQPSLAFQRSKDCNPRSATPSDVRGKQGIIISHADHGEAALTAFSVEWIARHNLTTLPGRDCTSWRFSDHASYTGNVPPCWGFGYQGTGSTTASGQSREECSVRSPGQTWKLFT